MHYGEFRSVYEPLAENQHETPRLLNLHTHRNVDSHNSPRSNWIERHGVSSRRGDRRCVHSSLFPSNTGQVPRSSEVSFKTGSGAPLALLLTIDGEREQFVDWDGRSRFYTPLNPFNKILMVFRSLLPRSTLLTPFAAHKLALRVQNLVCLSPRRFIDSLEISITLNIARGNEKLIFALIYSFYQRLKKISSLRKFF